jgi:hypothetical protein
MGYTRPITSQALLTEWLRHPIQWVLVGIASLLSVLDVIWTLGWIKSLGMAGEANPAARWLFQYDLQLLWSVITIAATTLGAALMSSMCMLLRDRERKLPVIGFSLLLTIRLEIVIWHLFFYADIATTTLILLVTAPSVFAFFRATLMPETADIAKRVIRWGGEVIREMEISLLIWASHPRSYQAQPRKPPRVTPKSTAYQARSVKVRRDLQTTRIAFWLIVAILAPIIGLVLIELISYLAGVPSLPGWMKRLGIVTQVQGQVFVASLIIILFVTGTLVYAVVSIFDALARKER